MRHVQDHQTKNNSCERWEATKPDASELIWQWSEHGWSAQPPVMAISLALHHGAAFPAEAAIIPLQTMQPCSTCPAGLHTFPAPGQNLSQAVTTAGSWQSLPKGGTGLLGCTTFPHVHYHTCFYSFHNSRLPFIFLTVLLPFFFNFQGIVGFFSFFPVYLFFLHGFLVFFSTQSYHHLCSGNWTFPQLLLSLYLWAAFIFNSAISLAVGQCTKSYQRFRFLSRGRLSRLHSDSDSMTEFSGRAWT